MWHISKDHTDFTSVVTLRIYAYPTISFIISRILERNEYGFLLVIGKGGIIWN